MSRVKARVKAISKQPLFREPKLAPNEYRRNYVRLDLETARLACSAEALAHCQAIPQIYLSLCVAPAQYYDTHHKNINDRVLLFEAEYQEPQSAAESADLMKMPGFRVLVKYLGRSPATCAKALHWLKEKHLIGYYAMKSGARVRIWLNVAVTGVGTHEAERPARASAPSVPLAPVTAPRQTVPVGAVASVGGARTVPSAPMPEPALLAVSEAALAVISTPDQKNLPAAAGSNFMAGSSIFVPALNDSYSEIILEDIKTHVPSNSSWGEANALRAASSHESEKAAATSVVVHPAPTSETPSVTETPHPSVSANISAPTSETATLTLAPNTTPPATPTSTPAAEYALVSTAFLLRWLTQTTAQHEAQTQLATQLTARQARLEENVKNQCQSLALTVRQAVAQGGPIAQHELHQLRQWLTDKALPKAVRVGVAEALRVYHRTGGQQAEQERLAAAMSVGASPDPATAAEQEAVGEAQIQHQALAHLARLAEALTLAAQRCPHAAVQEALAETAQTLTRSHAELATDVAALDLERLEATLVQWEAWLQEALRVGLPPQVVQTARQTAERSLQSFKERMDAAGYQKTLAQMWDRNLCTGLGVPGFSLYTL